MVQMTPEEQQLLARYREKHQNPYMTLKMAYSLDAMAKKFGYLQHMKTADVVYLAECKDCREQYGFVTAAERDAYLSTWHAGHQVSRTSQAVK